VTKKAVKVVKNKKRLAKLAPEELENIWNTEIAEAWTNLKPKHQTFLVTYINVQFNGSEAYRQVYNQLASDKVAAASAARILVNANMQAIFKAFTGNKALDLIKIKKAFDDALEATTPHFSGDQHVGDYDDHKTRILAANSLAKLNGELEDRGPPPVVNNTLVVNGQIQDMNDYLAKVGQKPIVQEKRIDTHVSMDAQPSFTNQEPEPNQTQFFSTGGDVEVVE